MSSVLRKIWRVQSTLSVRRATDEAFGTRVYFDISIHALREESDCRRVYPSVSGGISIHALREESDDGVGVRLHLVLISIHALREESDAAHVDLRGVAVISIHALREESDWRRKSACVR